MMSEYDKDKDKHVEHAPVDDGRLWTGGKAGLGPKDDDSKQGKKQNDKKDKK
jgi:hypothetical protein